MKFVSKKYFVILALIVCALFFIFRGSNSYSMQVDVSLEVDGKPLVISRVTKCLPFTNYMGFEKRVSYYLDPKARVFGHRLENGSAILLWIPEACQRARSNQKTSRKEFSILWPEVSEISMPLLGWLDNADNTDAILMYTSPYAYQNPNSRIAFKKWNIKMPDIGRKVNKADEYSWLGTTENPFDGKKNRNLHRSYQSDPYHQSFYLGATMDWQNEQASPFVNYDPQNLANLKAGRYTPKPIDEYYDYLKKNKVGVKHIENNIVGKKSEITKIKYEDVLNVSYIFPRYQLRNSLFRRGSIGESPFHTLDDVIRTVIRKKEIYWNHRIPVEINEQGNFVRKDLEGFMFLYSSEYLDKLSYQSRPVVYSKNYKLDIKDFLLGKSIIQVPDEKKLY